tara:strand:- start:12039 stop:12812 length:774 start_codon:yes stop_codon:yes gene_type:complete
MKFGIVISARLGSTRLPRKHLLDVKGEPILKYLIIRIKNEFRREINLGSMILFIATSKNKEDKDFNIFKKLGIEVFFGSNDNIPLRQLQVAKKYNLNYILSIDGDDILCSPLAMRMVYEKLGKDCNYVSTNNLPLGMNVSGYSTEFLNNSLLNYKNDILETGWGRIFDNNYIDNIYFNPLSNIDKKLRFTLDYNEDYIFFNNLITKLHSSISYLTDKEIVDEVIENKLYKLNGHLIDLYKKQFEKSLDMEKQRNSKK